MKPRDERPRDARIEYRWRVDVDAGFETSLIYDAQGRLVGADYRNSPRAKQHEPAPAVRA